MKLYAIAPKNGVEVVKEHKSHLVVAQWLEDKDYRMFYKALVAKGHELILDNGAYEFGVGMEGEQYWKIIGQLKPTIVVVPDKFRDAEQTVQSARAFFQEMEDRCLETQFELMGVPQGQTIEEWFACYRKLAPLVDVIGIPTAQWGDRTGIVRHFLASKLDNMIEPRIHLLGCWNPMEVMMYKDVPRVKSIDTSLPFKYAERGWMINRCGNMDTVVPADWKMKWDAEYTKEGPEFSLWIANTNLMELMRMCEGV